MALLVAVRGTTAGRAPSPSEQAARLDADLTPVGAERAGNADGSITTWTGGLPMAPARSSCSTEGVTMKPVITEHSMSTMKVLWLGVCLAGAVSLAAQQAPAVPEVLGDGAGAVFRRVDNMHQTRFVEIFLAAREAGTGNIVAACFNTMFTSGGIPVSKDTAPQALVEGLDFAKLKAQYGVLGASLNGPKLWLPDWTEIDAGKEREFNGIPAAWVAQLNMGSNTSVGETMPYKPATIARKSALGWNTGTTVILLDDAEGNTWIMKGFQLGLKPQYTYKEFVASAASRFKTLPKGWKVRVKTLDRDLIEKPEGGVATIMSDEFFNVYDKTGPGMSNYRP